METRGPVLAAVDLSEISPFVVRAAHGLAVRLGAPLLVVHCDEALTEGAEGDALLPSLRHQVEEARRAAEADLRGVLAAAGLGEDAVAESAVVAGDPEEAVPAEARRLGARLVVVGAPHPHRMRDTVAHRIVRNCSAPVLVARRSPAGGYRSVLVAVDFSPACAETWSFAAALTGEGASLLAWHAVADEPGRADAERRLAAWAGERSGKIPWRASVEVGSPKAALLGAAARERADLVALGRTAHRSFAELLLGALPEKIAASAPCDVLVVGGTGEDRP